MVDTGQLLQHACNIWYHYVIAVFFLAVTRTVVDDDGEGGTAPDPILWSCGALPKKARTEPTVWNLA